MNNKGADQTAGMRRLIYAFVVHIGQKQVFSWWGLYKQSSKINQAILSSKTYILESLESQDDDGVSSL